MKYTCTDDFFAHAATVQRLSREQELAYAQQANAGDATAKQALTDSYLPVLASYLKRYVKTPSLHLVYLGIQMLDKAVASFDFSQENPAFSKYLGQEVKKLVTRYIADNPNSSLSQGESF